MTSSCQPLLEAMRGQFTHDLPLTKVTLKKIADISSHDLLVPTSLFSVMVSNAVRRYLSPFVLHPEAEG
jgi:hypothetical protein